mgnify:CR=1 FL=1
MQQNSDCAFERSEAVSLYIHQAQLFWGLVSPISIIEIASLAGWFAAETQGMHLAGRLSLVGGMIFLVFQSLLLNRAGQYLGHFSDVLDSACGNTAPEAYLGLSGRKLAIGMCLILFSAHCALLFVNLEKDGKDAATLGCEVAKKPAEKKA